MTALEQIKGIVETALRSKKLKSLLKDVDVSTIPVVVEYPRDPSHGDYATNIAMALGKRLGKNPMEVAKLIVEEIKKMGAIETNTSGEGTGDTAPLRSAVIAGPGFINFKVAKKVIIDAIEKWNAEKKNIIKDMDAGADASPWLGVRVMVEFAHPNTHKAFHIGHLRNICLGEALVRILESQGAHVFRANYQGDIGPHVAKCIWGMMHMPSDERSEAERGAFPGPEASGAPALGFEPIHTAAQAKRLEAEYLTTPQRKVEYLGMAYAFGGTAFESDKDGTKGVQAEVKELNMKIYKKDPSIMPLWEITRRWSLDYFDYIYKRLGSHFDHLFFESQMYERGTEIVRKHMQSDSSKKGEKERRRGRGRGNGRAVFEESDGAIVFKGEPYGLHTRVFITKEGNATYEGKEMANVETQYATWNFDKIIHIVANEQSGYFKVVFKAIELIEPKFEGKQFHVDYGMVNLASGKMSSRTGDVVTEEHLINEVERKVREVVLVNNTTKIAFSEDEATETIEKIAIAAIKFTMLHADSKKDIAFDMEQSLRLTGDTGPYLLYGYTRIHSILEKVGMGEGEEAASQSSALFNDLDWKLAKQLLRFEEEVTKSANELTTHNLTHYLLELVSDFSRWYENNRVFGDNVKEPLRYARGELLKGVKSVLANGFYLLGIEPVTKM